MLRAKKTLPHATLGKRRATPYTYDASLLEAIPLSLGRELVEREVWVANLCLRFTSLCPVTGQPDWAEIDLNYLPDKHLIESKSLKEYLGSFRMHGDFHEDVCRIIVDDLVRCIQPRYLEVSGRFDSRGSVAIWPYVQYAVPGDSEMAELRRHRLFNWHPGAWSSSQPVR